MGKKSSAALDRRRTTLRNRQQAAEKASEKSTSLDARLESVAVARAEYASRLRAAQDEAAGMKKAVKGADKKREKLSSRRENARRDEAKAHRRIAPAEAKYERAVLADLVQREKARDLAIHTTTPAVVPPPAPMASPVTQLAASPRRESAEGSSPLATDPGAPNTTPRTSRSTTPPTEQSRTARPRGGRASTRANGQSGNSAR